MKGTNLFLNTEESKFLALSIIGTLDLLKTNQQNVKIPFNPQSRKDLKDMISAGTSLKIKMEKLGFDMSDLPDLYPGEENEYLTKES